MAMNPEVKAAWVERLRSLPNDMQARSTLKEWESGKMCCLGVLTEMAVEQGIIEPGVEIDVSDFSKVTQYTDEVGEGTSHWYGLTPPSVVKWAGMETNNPDFVHPEHGQVNLAYLNDHKRFTFDQIADEIEVNL